MFSLLKTKFLAVGAGIIAILLGIIKFLRVRNTTLKNEVNIARKELKFRADVDTIEEEIEQEYSHRADEARRDIDEGTIPEHLRNPRD